MTRTADFIEHRNRIESQIVSPLLQHGDKFSSGRSLVEKFREVARTLPGEPGFDIRQFNSLVNEMCVATLILAETPSEAKLHYEPGLASTAKTVDFLLVLEDGQKIWVDAKTVDPEWQDDDRAERHVETMQRHLPSNVHFVVNGPAYHHMQAARGRFLEYALEFEDKIRLLTPLEHGFYRMVYCGTGFSWHRSALEDFADFYRTGRHRADDGFRNMEAFYIQSNGLQLDRSINDICLVFRPTETEAVSEVRCSIKGPTFS
jgi:hypothetical protein